MLPEKRSLVRALIYPVPDPAFPFLGVHFTRRVDGSVEAGPNAVLAFMREGYTKSKADPRDIFDTFSYPGFWSLSRKYWKVGVGEIYRSFSKAAFTRALQKLLPEVEERDLVPGGACVRAQAVDADGRLVDDFAIIHTEGAIHVCNAPSPGATASLMIGKKIADMAEEADPALADCLFEEIFRLRSLPHRNGQLAREQSRDDLLRHIPAADYRHRFPGISRLSGHPCRHGNGA